MPTERERLEMLAIRETPQNLDRIADAAEGAGKDLRSLADSLHRIAEALELRNEIEQKRNEIEMAHLELADCRLRVAWRDLGGGTFNTLPRVRKLFAEEA